MRYYALVDGQGRVVSSCATSEELPPQDALPPGLSLVPLQAAIKTSEWYHDGQQLQPCPPRPSQYHRFDYADRSWKLDVGMAWAAVRAQRDRLLAECDWVTIKATETGQSVPPQWLAYRQALRDVPAQSDPLNIVWPLAPAG